ncbi:MAG: molybdopterin cofactor-binding domain-containing protein [Candidatus Binatia bacterium]
MSARTFGEPVRRLGDERLVRGAARYLDDITLPGMAHVAFVRSPHAHARIRSIDLRAARGAPGAIEAVTHADLRGRAAEAFPLILSHRGLTAATWCALAPEKTRFVGEPVVAVVAESRYLAEDAAELVAVEYEPLTPVVDLESARADGAPLVHEHAPGNVAMHILQRYGDAAAALAAAPFRLAERFRIVRGCGLPLETRGVIASADGAGGKLTVWSSTQEPHTVRQSIATVLGLDPSAVRVIAPDTGGGFGAKLNTYPEEILIPWLALRLGRPIKWVEDRREHLQAATQEREQIHDVEVGFDAEGRILALHDRFLHDTGAYVPRGAAVPYNTSSGLPGPYVVPHFTCEGFVVFTNMTTVGPYRGAGQPQATFVMERIMDRIAAQRGCDPADVRLRNMIPPERLPWDTRLTNLLGGRVEYDSGDFAATLRHALEAGDYAGLRRAQQRAREAGRYVGIGIASYVELTGRGPWEGAAVEIDAEGRVTVVTGAPTQGQGHETTLAQICADELGVPLESIAVNAGDTALIPRSIGTFASRVAVLGGNATHGAAREVRERVLDIAARLLEVQPADLVLGAARVSVQGAPARSVSLRAVAQAADAPLAATCYFEGPKTTYAHGTHLVALEVDPDTGRVAFLKYVVAHDSGRIINPIIVNGQIQGGVATGIGNALLEECVFDTEGQPLTTTLMDYLLPTAADVPHLEIVHLESPSPLNPLGVKGAGEAGVIPVPAAVCAAIEDALQSFGVRIAEAPLSPMRIRRAIERAARPGAAR